MPPPAVRYNVAEPVHVITRNTERMSSKCYYKLFRASGPFYIIIVDYEPAYGANFPSLESIKWRFANLIGRWFMCYDAM